MRIMRRLWPDDIVSTTGQVFSLRQQATGDGQEYLSLFMKSPPINSTAQNRQKNVYASTGIAAASAAAGMV